MKKYKNPFHNYSEITLGGFHNRFLVQDFERVDFVQAWKEEHGELVNCHESIFNYNEDAWVYFNEETLEDNGFGGFDSEKRQSLGGFEGSSYPLFIPIDIDSDDIACALEDTRKLKAHLTNHFRVEEDLIVVQFSGSKGFHVSLPSNLFALKPSSDSHLILKYIVRLIVPKEISYDEQIYSRNRLLRLENTKNPKSGLYKIRLIGEEIDTMSIDDITLLAKEPRSGLLGVLQPWQIRQRASEKIELARLYNLSLKQVQLRKKKPSPRKQYKKLLEGNIEESTRNNTLTSIAGKLVNLDISSDLVDSLLKGVNEAYCNPPLPEKEVESILKSIRKYPSVKKESGGLNIFKVSDIQESPEIPWMINNMIPKGFSTIIYGEGGKGKSMLALYLAIQACRGEQAFCELEFPSEPQNVLYLDWELNKGLFRWRSEMISKGLGLDNVPDNLLYSSPQSTLPKLLKEVRWEVQSKDIQMVIIDSFTPAGVDPKDENLNISVLNDLREMGVTSLLLDHQSKMQQSDYYNQKTPYGTVYKTNLARSVFQLTSKQNGYVTSVSLKHKKSNFGPELDDLCLDLIFNTESIKIQSESRVNVNEVDINAILAFVEDRTKQGEAVLQKDIIDGFRGRYSKGRILELLREYTDISLHVSTGPRGAKQYQVLKSGIQDSSFPTIYSENSGNLNYTNIDVPFLF